MEVEELFANLLNCGTSDWACLNECNMDIREIAKEVIENEGRMPDLVDILIGIFHHGIYMMKIAVEERIEDLENLPNSLHEKYSQDVNETLSTIRKLNPLEDMSYNVNYLDSSMSIVNHKDIYEKYFANTIEEIEDMTGYNINR